MAIRNVTESVRIEKEIYRKVCKLAEREGRLKTWMISRLLELGLEAHESLTTAQNQAFRKDKRQ